MNYQFDSIEDAIKEIQKGKLVIIMDSKEREYEGDFVGAAAKVNSETINFMLTYARGAFVAVFMPAGRCDTLQIPAMASHNDSFNHTKFKMSIDAKSNVSGSSAIDRAQTVNLLGDPNASPPDFVRPGHVIPIEAHPKGIFGRRGHTEAGVELVRLAGIEPAAAVDLEILDEDGRMAHEERLFWLARKFGLKIITLDGIFDYLMKGRKKSVGLGV